MSREEMIDEAVRRFVLDYSLPGHTGRFLRDTVDRPDGVNTAVAIIRLNFRRVCEEEGVAHE